MPTITATVILALLSLAAQAIAQQAPAPPAPAAVEPAETAGRLPVRRVVLYKNGVGYFEHSTRVYGTQDLNIDFTSAQLNDVLKSLTVVDLGGGHINGVRFNSVAPLSERLKTLRLPLGEQASRNDLLGALRGTRVEVHNGANSTAGKVLGFEVTKKFGANPQQTEDVTVLTLVTDAGEVRSFDLGPGTSVRIADRELAEEVNRYLNLIGSARAVDLRRLTISAAGAGEREIFVSYISEVPVWKSTYRVLLDSQHSGQPLVQGWAVVDNTIGEDWKDVQLSLVAGAPQSFVQNISQPLYVQRPEVPLPESAMLTPETHEAALMKMEPAPPPPPPPPPAPAAGGMGIASGLGFGGGRGRALSEALENRTITAESTTVGDYFAYDLKERVTIGKNQSALVPILQSRMEAEKVTLWNAASGTPRRALWLNNTSGTELDAGSFDILDENTFAGEGILDAVRPGEKRLISYAADTAVQVKSENESSHLPFNHIVVIKGLMTMTRDSHETQTYTVSNSDAAPRDVVIEHPAREDWKLAEGLKPDETTASFYRFRVKVQPRTSAKLVVEEVRHEGTEVQLSNLNTGWIDLLSQQKRMAPSMETAFKRVLDQKAVVSSLAAQIQTRQQEEKSIADDQARIRENMKALKGSPEEKALVQRYTQQLNSQEDRLTALHNQIADLTAQRRQASDQLDKILAEIALDEKF